MLSAIDNLREIARRCVSGEPLDEDLSSWLGRSLEDYLSQGCQSIEEALGLKFPRGGIPWWREEAIRVRDGALRDLSRLFYPDCTPCARAREIWTVASRYAASTWRFDNELEAMPEHYLGTQHEFLWQAFKSGAAMPIGERQLRNILPS